MSAARFTRHWALDASGPNWKTINGAHVPLDGEGELTGSVGKKIRQAKERKQHVPRPLETTAPDMDRYWELVKAQGGNAKKGAHEYFKEYLQDTYMEARTNEGPIEVHFTGASWKEFKKGMDRDPIKAGLTPHVADIIATGEYAPERPGPQHPDVSVVHTYRKTKDTPDGPRNVVVDVLEWKNPEQDQPKTLAYSLNREGSPAWEKREKESASSRSTWADHAREKKPTQDSVAAVDENVGLQFEVVNIRIEDVTVDEDTIVANVTARFREWLKAERQALLARDAAPEGCGRVRPGCFTGTFAGLNRISVDGEGRSWA